MAKEIEHKFLVNPRALPRPLPAGKKLTQGYLSDRPAVRVRLITGGGRSAQAFLTIKGSGLRERDEYEYEISVADARRLLKLCGKWTLSKIRRRIGRWEIDQFLGRHRGLWLAEYELRKASERLPKLPPWISREVTSDARYTNMRLARPDRRSR